MLPKLRRLLPALLLLVAVCAVVSCKKRDTSLQDQSSLLDKNGVDKNGKKATITVEPYNSVVYDSCRQENVILTGQATYKLIETFDNGYYIYYEITLDKVTGVGERTGTVYHGGGKILGTTKLSADYADNKSKVTYKVKYVGGNGNQIIFNQSARFIMVNNVTKVEFNDVMDTCK